MEPEKESLVPPPLNTFSGDWDTYEEALYEIFNETLARGGLKFLGLRVSIQRLPDHKKKHFTFWHLVSEGEVESERTPDLRRCERLTWVQWVILNASAHAGIFFWESKRKGSTNVVIWFEEGEYAVVLAKRNGYYLLKTAYVVSTRRAKAFRREMEEFKKTSQA